MPSHFLLRFPYYLRNRCLIDHTDRLHDERLRPGDRLQKRRNLGVSDPYCDRHVHLLVGDGVDPYPPLSEPILTY